MIHFASLSAAAVDGAQSDVNAADRQRQGQGEARGQQCETASFIAPICHFPPPPLPPVPFSSLSRNPQPHIHATQHGDHEAGRALAGGDGGATRIPGSSRPPSLVSFVLIYLFTSTQAHVYRCLLPFIPDLINIRETFNAVQFPSRPQPSVTLRFTSSLPLPLPTLAPSFRRYNRGVYPSAVFERRRKYDVPVFMSRHPDLNLYIHEVLQAAGGMLMEGSVDKIVLTLYGSR